MCQYKSETDNVGANLNKIMSIISQTEADVYVFPELFLTGYGANYAELENEVEFAINKMKLWCMEKDIAIIAGAPSYFSDGMKNSLLFVTPTDIAKYDKLYLARFGIYSEKEFVKGENPIMFSFKGITFGLSVCYDVFFPEIHRHYALSGADVNICVGASDISSKEYFDIILPARSLENVMYTVFVNAVGRSGDLSFYGTSRLIGPLGDTLCEMGDEEKTICVYLDREVVAGARKKRRHLEDRRSDIRWQPDAS